MNKMDLVDKIADTADLTKASAARALDATVDAITNALRDGDQVSLIGFGTFLIKNRPERQGRNPQTGAIITIKAARVPNFRAGKALKEAVN